MSFKNVFLGLGLLLSTVTSSFAGFGLETTRVIYNEQSNNEGFVAFNTDKDTNYLLQSWIEDLNGEVTQNFVITPPLLKLVAQQKNTLQVTKNITLPNDIESMYWINVKFVAPSNENLENVLRYSMTNKIKLIYRPQLLSNINIEDEVKKLKWSLKNGNMVVTNNTPFFVNIGKIVLNNNEIQDNPGYLPPKSETIIKINKVQSSQNKIQLIYIDDFGKGVPVDFTL
ncbi:MULTISPECIES: fimbrial biogenesis chaperone [Proteus]|uniref:fimbrial biogenesis chaperone n=1 Tax=Proteus TaxID=583 RepID=UPI000D68748A|nr:MULTISPECIES: molecular chaperone [Proteus]MBG5949413.1 molecular chaperone [Proteus terrae]MCE9840189.1 molecular chaperone [Proteus terrae]NBN69804.1 fimbria/pilus periplasmic chaperone [Proteus sp. G2618]